LKEEDQLAFVLKTISGFGVQEIAKALVTNEATVQKRLYRAKEFIRKERIEFEIPAGAALTSRLEVVHTLLYLLFNEGYNSGKADELIRKDLCGEAMRLCKALIEHRICSTPTGFALLSLMCFHSSRFDARLNHNGEIILYQDQDTDLWNQELIEKGEYFLNQASEGNTLSKYHLEAGIAYWHTIKADSENKWESILFMYNHLLLIEYSPIAALNRTYALAKADGKEKAIVEAEKLTQLSGHHLYHSLMGYLYKGIDKHEALQHLQIALKLAKTSQEKNQIRKSIGEMEKA